MSILIKGLKMPKSCSTCQMLEGDAADGICHAAGRWLDDDEYWTWYVYPEGDIDDSRPSNCPLIELPDHGDLIDRDVLKAELGITDWECEKCGWHGLFGCKREGDFSDACFFLENAEAVIPAERNEDANG